MEIRGVYETVLYGADLGAMRRFYVELLGLRLVNDPASEVALAMRLADGNMLLVFDPRQSARGGRGAPTSGASGPGHVAFAVDEEGFESLRQAFAQAGIAIELERGWDPGGRSIYVRDPAGNSVEFVVGEAWPR